MPWWLVLVSSMKFLCDCRGAKSSNWATLAELKTPPQFKPHEFESTVDSKFLCRCIAKAELRVWQLRIQFDTKPRPSSNALPKGPNSTSSWINQTMSEHRFGVCLKRGQSVQCWWQ